MQVRDQFYLLQESFFSAAPTPEKQQVDSEMEEKNEESGDENDWWKKLKDLAG